MAKKAHHKSSELRRAIDVAECEVRVLMPFCPGLNQIEKVFSKLKATLRKAAKRIVEALWEHLGRVTSE